MKIGIIGGGVLGLTLGYRLSEKGHQVEIIEAAPQIGGLSTWFDYGEFVWDKYYHVILKSDYELINLINELGLEDQLCWTKTKTGFLWQGSHHSMSNHWEFLKFPPLNLFQKFRLALGILYSDRIKDPTSLEKMTAKTWLTRVFGSKVYSIIWEPLLESKFGTLKDKVPATIIWSTINRYYSTRQKKGGSEYLGHLRNVGLKSLLDTLSDKIEAKQGKIHCSSKLLAIDTTSSKGVIAKTDKGEFSYDQIISTIPTMLLRSIAPQFTELYTSSYYPQFIGVIRLALILKRSLCPYYVTNIIDRGYPFTGIIEVSRLTDESELSGHHLVMVPRYDTPDSDWFKKSENEISDIFLKSMKTIWPDIEDNILHYFVHKERIVQALWIEPPSIERPPMTRDAKVMVVNNELAGRSTLNNNELIKIANKVVKELA